MPEAVLRTPCHTMSNAASFGDPGTHEPADKRVRATRWDATDPGDDVPRNRPHQRAEDNEGSMTFASTMPLPMV